MKFERMRPDSYRFRFCWAWPRVTRYRAADRRRLVVHLNRYPGVVIGVAVQVGVTVLGVTWGRPGRRVHAGRHRSGAR